MSERIVVEIEEALGTGIEFVPEGRSVLGIQARHDGAWRGLDRGAFPDTDDGRGVRLAALVATPVSTWVGCRLAVDLLGGWRSRGRVVLLCRLSGANPPDRAVAADVGAIAADAEWLEPSDAAQELIRARQRFRERRSRDRVLGGRAWLPDHPMRPEEQRFSTPHSRAEYALHRLPPRYLRGLEGLLDDDERLIDAIERPELQDPGWLARLRGEDRRAALLAMTDRQLVWAVDHAQPDRYLSDWGVDLELVPLERIRSASVSTAGGAAMLEIDPSVPPQRRYRLPFEVAAEVEVMTALLARFGPGAAGHLPMRRYQLDTVSFEDDWAARFGQLALAQQLFERARVEVPIARLFSPRRDGRPHAAAAVLGDDRVVVVDEASRLVVPLALVAAITCTISALIGRIGLVCADGIVAIDYPSPLASMGATFARLARRALADTSSVLDARPASAARAHATLPEPAMASAEVAEPT